MSSPGQQALLPPSGARDTVEPFAVWSAVVVIGGGFWAAMIYVVATLAL